MKKATFLRKMLWLLFIPFLTTACEDNMDKHYEVPNWVPASIWDILEEKGNFSIFLQGTDLAGYKQMLEGKSLLTVMAPDDDAFKAYLTENNYSSISDMPKEELKKLIAYHLLYYSYNKENLINFRPEGNNVQGTEEDQAQADLTAGLYYKHRTKSADAPTWETTQYGEKVMVYHYERYLPVFSYRYFQTKKIDAKYNYEYFFPESKWSGSEGFNVANASVKEYGIPAQNGYIHTLSQVIKPLETINTELKNREEYSTFYSLCDTYSIYPANKELTKDYAAAYGVDTLYLHQHSSIPNIACEWPDGATTTDFRNLTRWGLTVFAPSNTAFEQFFNNFWGKGGYSSLDEVDKSAVSTMMNQFVYNGSLIFPEEIETINSEDGAGFNIDPEKVKDHIMCANGALYGMDEIQTPTLFQTVVGPIYKYDYARSMMYALRGSGTLSSYISQSSKYTLLIPSTEQFENSDIYTSFSTQDLEEDGDGGRVTIGTTKKRYIMYIHSASISGQNSTELPMTGSKTIATQASWNFWFINNGKITSNKEFNLQLNPQYTGDPFHNFTKLDEGNNGTVYTFDGDQIFMIENEELGRSIAICVDKKYVYHRFAQLMKAAGLVEAGTTSDGSETYLLSNILAFDAELGRKVTQRFIAFIPTNEAIEKAIQEGSIPGVSNASFDADGNLTGTFDKEVLTDYLNSYFLCATNSVITTYPYIGSTMTTGNYTTLSNTNKNIVYTDNGNSLSVQLPSGKKCNVVSQYHYFPFAFNDGCFHLIEDTF